MRTSKDGITWKTWAREQMGVGVQQPMLAGLNVLGHDANNLQLSYTLSPTIGFVHLLFWITASIVYVHCLLRLG
jgi:hypothetical protein